MSINKVVYGGKTLIDLTGVLHLAVLAHEQHGALAVVEIVHLQGVDEQSGLAAVQKPGDEI